MDFFKITKVVDLKNRIDFAFSVFRDKQELGAGVVFVYAQDFVDVPVEERESLVLAKIAADARKFIVAKDVLTATTAFASLIGKAVKLEPVIYPPKPTPVPIAEPVIPK